MKEMKNCWKNVKCSPQMKYWLNLTGVLLLVAVFICISFYLLPFLVVLLVCLFPLGNLFWSWGVVCFFLCFPRTIHILLIVYKKILEVANLLLIQRTSCSFLLSSIEFFLFFFSSPFIFLLIFSFQGTSQHNFPLFYASLINDAIICHAHRSKPRFFRKTCQHRKHKLFSSTAIGHKCNRSIHKLWLLFVCFSLAWQQHNG